MAAPPPRRAPTKFRDPGGSASCCWNGCGGRYHRGTYPRHPGRYTHLELADCRERRVVGVDRGVHCSVLPKLRAAVPPANLTIVPVAVPDDVKHRRSLGFAEGRTDPRCPGHAHLPLGYSALRPAPRRAVHHRSACTVGVGKRSFKLRIL